jgi:ATP-dependent RNA helicase RhlB
MEPELLVMPKPRALDPEYAANVAADSAAFGDVVPPRPGEAPRHGRTGGAHGSERHGAGPGSASRAGRARRPAVGETGNEGGVQATAVSPASPVVAVAPGVVATAAADGSGKPESVRKPRRHRGGRGRTHRTEDGASVEAGATNADNVPASRAPRGPRRPQRERLDASPAVGVHRPSRQVAVTAGAPSAHAHPKKPGLFRRLTRLFTGH